MAVYTANMIYTKYCTIWIYMATCRGQKIGTLVNNQKNLKWDYLRVAIIPKKVARMRFCPTAVSMANISKI